jgi:hypothetical protein
MKWIVSVTIALGLVAACDDGGGTPGDDGLGDDIALDTQGDAPLFEVAACDEGLKRCVAQQTQQCITGEWRDLFECPASQACVDGACQTDGNPGCSCEGKTCGDDGCGNSCGICSASETCENDQCESAVVCSCAGAACGVDGCGNSCGTCQGGQRCDAGTCVTESTCSCNGALCGFDNCGNSCGTCPNGSNCQAGQCVVQSVGTGCNTIIDCIVDGCFPEPPLPQDQAATCQNACIGAGSATGQTEFNAYVACLNTCPDDGFGYCVAANCSTDRALCFFDASGGSGCLDIIDCLVGESDIFGDTIPGTGCPQGDAACVEACYETGTVQAQAALLAVNSCLNEACPTGSPDSCTQTAIDGVCATYANGCN